MRSLLLFLALLCLPMIHHAADYYWVGGSGNWSDISHWAATSGGSVTYQQAPSADDNVIFDASSFNGPDQTVTVNTDIIFFRNMSWDGVTNNPSFVGPQSASMNIFGSMLLTPNMNFEFEGSTKYSGAGLSKGVNYAGHDAGYNLIFEGDGEWILEGAVSVDSMFQIRQGSLNTNSQEINTRYFYITSDNPKDVALTNSNITVTGEFIDTYLRDEYDVRSMVVNIPGLTLDPGTSRINIATKNPYFWVSGDGSLDLYDLIFSSATGSAILSSGEFDENTANLNELSIFSSASIYNKIAVNTINLTGGNVYEFAAGKTYDFGVINANGNCANGVIVTSTENSSFTTLNVPSGIIDISFLTLRDIHTTGGATFMAPNGVDLGNNTGWTFTNNASEDFYWIDGSGNWSDAAHWSYTSGGTPSGCVPSGKDNVFFDANSFSAVNQVVTVDKENIYMHDMTWSGVTNNPELAGDVESKIRIIGSLEFDASMEHSFEGSYYFESNESDLTVKSNGIIFNLDVSFSGEDGEWLLEDDLETKRDLILKSGLLNIGGNKVTIYRFESRFQTIRTLDISDGEIILRQLPDENYYQPYWQVGITQYSVVSDNSTIEFTGSWVGGFFHDGDLESGSIPHYDNVIFSNYIGTISSNGYDLEDGLPSVIIDSTIFRNRGELFGSSSIGFLQLQAGYDYAFDSYEYRDDIQTIGKLNTAGSCDAGLTKLYASSADGSAKIILEQDFISARLDIQGLNVLSNNVFTANTSIDGGDNTNITFTDFTARTLYWVNNGGLWHDSDHWSLTSGGAGGECIPTAIDDVIFDTNSFDMDFQQVQAEGNRFRNCHDITWTNTTNNPTIIDNFLVVNGSLEYDDSFRNDVWQTWLTSLEQEVIDPGGQYFRYLRIHGKGVFDFISDFEGYEFEQNAGVLNFNDISIREEYITFYTIAEKTINLGNSHLTIFRGPYNTGSDLQFRDWSEKSLTIEPGSSLLSFTGSDTGIFSDGNISLHNIHFSNPIGTATISTSNNLNFQATSDKVFCNKLTFNGSGEIRGIIESDSLIGAAGKTYTFEAEHTSQVNSYLQMIGNNCTPIELVSSQSGSKATIEMPSTSKIIAEFIQMRDMRGIGGADFNAGARSTDIGNSNIGWFFEDPPDFVESGFLGVDRALCTGQDLELNAYSFSPNEVYSWNDGSMDSILTVGTPGEYFVEVQFESDCILRDTIEIFTAQDIMASLPPLENICEGTILTLDAEVPIATADYTWNDGSTNAMLDVTEAGDYTVNIDVDGCTSSASSTVSVVENPGLDLGGDRSICEGDPFILSTDVVATSYLWQDGSSTTENIGILQGLYWLEIEFDNCTFRDSSTITFAPRPTAEIGNDTTVCSNENLVLSLDNPGDLAVSWQDGSTNNDLNVTETGPYVVILDDNGCADKDSIFVIVQEAPALELENELEDCVGEDVILVSNVVADDYAWSSGESTNQITITVLTNATYSLTVTEGECIVVDQVSVIANQYPEVDLGPAMQEVCENVSLVLDAGEEGLWQDGSVTQILDVLADGSYSVTVSNSGCETVASTEITFLESPEVDLGPDIFECEGEGVVLAPNDPTLDFEWEDGSIEVTRDIESSGEYILTVEENGCIESDSISVSFQALPRIVLGQDTTVCDDVPFIIIPLSQTTGNLEWEDGSNSPNFLVESPGLINVTLTEGLCVGRDSIQVNFKDCIDFEVFIPNAFSPNEDGVNDRFEIFFAEGLVIESFDITIFDRWGNRVFTSKSTEESWDGKFNTQDLDTGVYGYFINVSYIDDFGPDEISLTGDITIMN